jgi:hypothetical protein
MREWVPVYIEALGAKPPRKVPAGRARLVAGKDAVAAATEMRGATKCQGQARARPAPDPPTAPHP